MSEANRDNPYSRAFESFVQDGEADLVGLLSYALYKQGIREAISTGRQVHTAGNRVPTQTEISVYRSTAERMLARYGELILEQGKADFLDSTLQPALAGLKGELIEVVTRRTSATSALVVNIIAWLVSIGITVLVALNGIPSWIGRLGGQ